MKYLSFLILFFLSTGAFVCFSAGFFKISISTFLFYPQQPFDVLLTYTLSGISEEHILVRPVVDTGISYVFNSVADTWVNDSDGWLNMPILNKKVSVKIFSFDPIITLKLKFLNQLTGDIYESNELKVWNYSLYKNYILKMIK